MIILAASKTRTKTRTTRIEVCGEITEVRPGLLMCWGRRWMKTRQAFAKQPVGNVFHSYEVETEGA